MRGIHKKNTEHPNVNLKSHLVRIRRIRPRSLVYAFQTLKGFSCRPCLVILSPSPRKYIPFHNYVMCVKLLFNLFYETQFAFKVSCIKWEIKIQCYLRNEKKKRLLLATFI